VNPFEQLKSFIRYNVELMNHKDVKRLIDSQTSKKSSSDEKSPPNYLDFIHKNYSEIICLLDNAKAPVLKHYQYLFDALQKLCNFWFEVKHQDISQVRKSDVYIYKLSYLLLERIGNNCYSSLSESKIASSLNHEYLIEKKAEKRLAKEVSKYIKSAEERYVKAFKFLLEQNL